MYTLYMRVNSSPSSISCILCRYHRLPSSMRIQLGFILWLIYPPSGVRMSSGDCMCDSPSICPAGISSSANTPYPCISEGRSSRLSGRGLLVTSIRLSELMRVVLRVWMHDSKLPSHRLRWRDTTPRIVSCFRTYYFNRSSKCICCDLR